MKKKKKKILSVVLAAAAVCGALAGCGGEEAVNTSGATTITVWSTDSHSKTIMENMVNSFNTGTGKDEGIEIDYQVIDGDSYNKSLELALQTGQGPDLMQTGLNKAFVDSGYLAAFDDIGYGDYAKECLEKYDKSAIAYKDKVYRVPVGATTRGLIYNKDMFKEAGLVDENGEPTPPETMDELREYAKKLTDKSNNKFGIILPMKWSAWVGSDIAAILMPSVGHCGFDPVKGEFDYSGLAPVINTYMGIIEDGSMYPGAEGIDNDTARAYFAEGIIGMKLAYSFDVGVLNDQFPAKCDWGVAPLPVVDADNRYYQPMSYTSGYCINAASVETKGADKLMKVMQWMVSDEVTKELYKAGANLPIDWNTVADVKIENPKTGWTEFAELASISCMSNTIPSTDMTGYLKLAERVTNQVLAGEVSAEEMLEQYGKDLTDAAKKYYDVNTDEKFEEHLNKDWNIKLEK